MQRIYYYEQFLKIRLNNIYNDTIANLLHIKKKKTNFYPFNLRLQDKVLFLKTHTHIHMFIYFFHGFTPTWVFLI